MLLKTSGPKPEVSSCVGGTKINTPPLCHSEKSKSRRSHGAVLGVCFGVCRGRSSGAAFRPFSTVHGVLCMARQRPSMKYWQWKESTLPLRSTTVYSAGSKIGACPLGAMQRERIVCAGSVRLHRYQAKANPAPKPETAPAIKAGSRIEVSIGAIIAQRGGTQ